MPKEIGPASLVFLVPLDDAENLSEPLAIDANGHQDRDIADFPAPRALEHDAIEVNIGEFILDGMVAPSFDLLVDLLVKVADRAGAYLRPPPRCCAPFARGGYGQQPRP